MITNEKAMATGRIANQMAQNGAQIMARAYLAERLLNAKPETREIVYGKLMAGLAKAEGQEPRMPGRASALQIRSGMTEQERRVLRYKNVYPVKKIAMLTELSEETVVQIIEQRAAELAALRS